VGAAAYQVAVFQAFELVVGPEVEHLGYIVSQIESCAVVNVIRVAPVKWGYYFFYFNMRADIFQLGS